MFSTLVHAVALLGIVACGTPDAKPRSPVSRNFRVALLTPGPISDQSWNGGAYNGLLRIRDSLGAQVSHIQTRTPADFEEQFRQYGSQGYDLVFGHGFEFQDAAKGVGPDFPKTVYVTTSSASSGRNVAGMAFAFGDASYLAGMVAASMSRSNIIGAIGGTELPPVKESFAAFAAGVAAVKPKAQVLVSYIGNWDDASAGKEQAIAQIGRGADVIFQNADAAGLGVFQAARETRKALIMGSNSNQNALVPEVTLGSVVIDLPRAFMTVAREVRDGRFHARVITLGLVDDVVALVLNPSMRGSIPGGTIQAVDSLQAEMKARRFTWQGGGR